MNVCNEPAEKQQPFDTNGGAHKGDTNPLSTQPPDQTPEQSNILKEKERLDEIEEELKKNR